MFSERAGDPGAQLFARSGAVSAGVKQCGAQEVGAARRDPVPCGVLEQAWQQFVSANDGCGRDEDCVIFDRVLYGAGGVCDGGHALMATLNAGALDMAVRYFDRVNSTECAIEPYVGRYWDHWTWVDYDRGFRVNPRCEAGRCTADWPDCRLEDGGN